VGLWFGTVRGMREPACVGAVVRDGRNRVYADRRTPERRLLPGSWDIIGGHLEAGETPQQALARELQEETGWRLRHVQAVIADWEWAQGGVVRRELDYLVEVDGDLGAPRLEAGKHDAYAWVGPDNLELMVQGRSDGDRRLRDIVAKAVRIRLTGRLWLEPVGPGHAQDLWRLHHDDAVAAWHGGRWTAETAHRRAAAMGRAWETAGVGKWIAYDRHTGELVGRGGWAAWARTPRGPSRSRRCCQRGVGRGSAWRSAGPCGQAGGGAAMRRRSAGRGCGLGSRTLARRRSWRSPNGTTGASVR